MLRISVQDGPGERNLVVEGRLTVPWIEDLRAAWNTAVSDLRGRRLVIDLQDVTAISDDGQRVLLNFLQSGACFRSGGLQTKQIIRNLLRRTYKPGGMYENHSKSPR